MKPNMHCELCEFLSALCVNPKICTRRPQSVLRKGQRRGMGGNETKHALRALRIPLHAKSVKCFTQRNVKVFETLYSTILKASKILYWRLNQNPTHEEVCFLKTFA